MSSCDLASREGENEEEGLRRASWPLPLFSSSSSRCSSSSSNGFSGHALPHTHTHTHRELPMHERWACSCSGSSSSVKVLPPTPPALPWLRLFFLFTSCLTHRQFSLSLSLSLVPKEMLLLALTAFRVCLPLSLSRSLVCQERVRGTGLPFLAPLADERQQVSLHRITLSCLSLRLLLLSLLLS